MVSIQVTHTIEIPDTFIEDAIIDPAGYGIGYWANLGAIDDEARTYTVKDMFGDYREKVLPYDKLAQTLVDIAYNAEIKVPQDWRGWANEALIELQGSDPEHAGGTIDADLADAIVQIAAFGEIIYG